jgi:hypothetical protein
MVVMNQLLTDMAALSIMAHRDMENLQVFAGEIPLKMRSIQCPLTR